MIVAPPTQPPREHFDLREKCVLFIFLERVCVRNVFGENVHKWMKDAHDNFKIKWKRKGLIINTFIVKQKANKSIGGLKQG